MIRVFVWTIALCGLSVLTEAQGLRAGDLICTLQSNSYPYSDLTTDRRSHLHFTLLSNRDGINAYEDWNSWGYFTRSFTATDSQSRYLEITRRPALGWDRNFPSVTTLNKGQFLITDIYLCDGSWRVSPRMALSSGQKLMIAGRFKQEREEGDEQFQIFGKPWIGSIESSPVEVALSKGCIASLDSNTATTGIIFRR
jgi:hypothetical protein